MLALFGAEKTYSAWRKAIDRIYENAGRETNTSDARKKNTLGCPRRFPEHA